MKISIDNIDAFVFDFDGVLTNNKVFFDENGKESVMCDRSDGLAFDVLRRLKKQSYILSTEKNQVVEVRANKLKIPIIQGINNKVNVLKELKKEEGIDFNSVLYMGNDNFLGIGVNRNGFNLIGKYLMQIRKQNIMSGQEKEREKERERERK